MSSSSGLSSFTCTLGWGGYLKLFAVCLVAQTAVGSMTIDVEPGNMRCVLISALKGNTIHGSFEVLTPGPLGSVMVILRHIKSKSLLYRKIELNEDHFSANANEDGDFELCFYNRYTGSTNSLQNKKVETERKRGINWKLKTGQEQNDPDVSEMAGTWEKQGTTSQSSPNNDLDSWYAEETPTKTFGFGLRVDDDVRSSDSADGSKEADEAEKAKAEKAEAKAERDLGASLVVEANLLMETLTAFNDHTSYMRVREERHRDHFDKASSRMLWCSALKAAVLLWVSWLQLTYIRRFFETKLTL